MEACFSVTAGSVQQLSVQRWSSAHLSYYLCTFGLPENFTGLFFFTSLIDAVCSITELPPNAYFLHVTL